MYIFDIHTSQIHAPCHLTLTVRALLTDHCSLDTTRCTTAGLQSPLRQFSGKVFGEDERQLLIFIVGKTLRRLLCTTLTAIQQIGGLEPSITQIVDQQRQLHTSIGQGKATLLVDITNYICVNTVEFQVFANLRAILYLQYHSRFLTEQHLDQIRFSQSGQTQIDTAAIIGKGHLQQGSNQTTG